LSKPPAGVYQGLTGSQINPGDLRISHPRQSAVQFGACPGQRTPGHLGIAANDSDKVRQNRKTQNGARAHLFFRMNVHPDVAGRAALS